MLEVAHHLNKDVYKLHESENYYLNMIYEEWPVKDMYKYTVRIIIELIKSNKRM